jgi:hypothetical protein
MVVKPLPNMIDKTKYKDEIITFISYIGYLYLFIWFLDVLC